MGRALLPVLAGGLCLLPGAPPGLAGADPVDDVEAHVREVYVPHPEFRPYHDREQLSVDQVTLVRLRRPDRTEVLVAKEDTGWEHVVVEGAGYLAFYSLARQPLRRGPGRHVVVQDWSGGAHCCFDYHVLHVQGVHVRREALIRGGDCALRVADVDGDGAMELVACDSRFAYAFDLSFAESPLIPLVYAVRDKGYATDSPRFPQVFRFRIAQERRRLAEAEQAGDARAARRAVISLLLHTLYAGRTTEAWCAFDKAYRWADRAAVRQEVLTLLRKASDPEDARLPLADVSYALAPPDRCR